MAMQTINDSSHPKVYELARHHHSQKSCMW